MAENKRAEEQQIKLRYSLINGKRELIEFDGVFDSLLCSTTIFLTPLYRFSSSIKE